MRSQDLLILLFAAVVLATGCSSGYGPQLSWALAPSTSALPAVESAEGSFAAPFAEFGEEPPALNDGAATATTEPVQLAAGEPTFADPVATPIEGVPAVRQTDTPETEATPEPEPSPSPSPEMAPDDPPARSAFVADQPSDVALPVRLLIPAVKVDAEFEYVGLTPEGAMDSPKDPDRVAWFSSGPRPGEPGNAAIAGHVDWAGQVRAFWWLRQLNPGDDIEVVAADGKSYHFQVEWSRWFDAATGDVGEVFGSAGVPEVTLITCGGAFDRQSRQYLSRLVLRAVMVP